MRARARSGLGASLLIAAALAAGGCGGGGARGGDRDRQGESGGSGEVASSASGPLNEAECLQLLDHYLELAMAEKRATLPPEQVPTEEQVARIRTEMRDRAKQSCVGLTERDRFDCAMRARTTRGVGTCLGGRAVGG